MPDTTLDPKLARVIEEARTRAGLTKYRLAVRAGLSLNTTRLACQGIATTRTLNCVAKALGVSVDELAGKAGAP
jgi:hypothetical protein